MKRLPHPCHQVTNWNRFDYEVAAELGISTDSVRNYRWYYQTGSFQRTRWETVDWSLRNVDIARSIGVTEAAVSYQRKKRLDKSRNKSKSCTS